MKSFQGIALRGLFLILTPCAHSGEEWVQHFNGPANGNDQAGAIATDASGNVFVTGYSIGTGSGYDFATIKYSAAGLPLWTNRYNGPGNNVDGPVALRVDPDGDVVVAGSSIGTNGFYDYAIIKYSNAGVPLWTNRYNGPANSDDTVSAMAISSAGIIFVAGASASAGIPPFNYTNFDYATVAYSSTGVGLWTNRYNGLGNRDDYATDIAADANGNVEVTGYSASPGGTYDFVTLKYSSTGVPLWTNRYHGPGSDDDFANAIATDNSGNVFVTGRAAATDTYYDYATVSYSSTGLPLWTNLYNGPGNGVDEPRAIAVDGDGQVGAREEADPVEVLRAKVIDVFAEGQELFLIEAAIRVGFRHVL